MVVWRGDNGPLGLEVVRVIESLLNYSFPMEYVEVVLSLNEGHPEPNRFDIQKRKG